MERLQKEWKDQFNQKFEQLFNFQNSHLLEKGRSIMLKALDFMMIYLDGENG